MEGLRFQRAQDASLSKEELSKEKERRYDDKRRFEDALERQTLGFQARGPAPDRPSPLARPSQES